MRRRHDPRWAVGAAGRPQLEVRRGLNVWRLLRTDADKATAAQVTQEAASAVRYFLGLGVSPGRDSSLVPSGHKPEEWRFGDVRPLQLVALSRQAGPAMPAGLVLADRTTSVPGTIPTVSGKRPWWVLVHLWWRGPTTRIDYPGVRQGLLWPEWSTMAADWVLDRAVYVPRDEATRPPDPGAEGWLPAVAEHAEEAVTEWGAEAGKWAVLLLILGYALAKK